MQLSAVAKSVRDRTGFHLLLVCAFLIAPSVYWIFKDNSIWPWDPAWYGTESLNLWHTFTHRPTHWFSHLGRVFEKKAPGISWFGEFFVPLGWTFGSVEKALLAELLLAHAISIWLVWRMTERLVPNNRVACYTAVLFVAGAPLAVQMTHVYFVEGLQLTAAVYFYWLAATAREKSRLLLIGHLLAATGLAMSAKVTSPLFCVVPGLVVVYRMFKPAMPRAHYRVRELLCLAAGGLLFAATVKWYVRNFHTLFAYAKSASSGEIALQYGQKLSYFDEVRYWLAAARKSFFTPELLLIIGLCAVAVVGSRWFFRTSSAAFADAKRVAAFAGLAALQTVIIFAQFGTNYSAEPRFILALLPSIVVLLVWLFTIVRVRLLQVLFCGALLAQWAIVHAQALGVMQTRSDVVELPRPQSDEARIEEINRLIHLVAGEQTTRKCSVVGVEYPWLNAVTLSFCALKASHGSPTSYFVSLGYAESNPDKAWQALNECAPAYFISQEPALQPAPNFVNRVNLSILQRIQNDKQFERVPFPSNFGLLIFKNVSGQAKD